MTPYESRNNMKEISLNMLALNQKGKVKRVMNELIIKRRLLDLGITEKTLIEKKLENITKNLSAYLFRNTLVAIRNEDAEKVIIEVVQ